MTAEIRHLRFVVAAADAGSFSAAAQSLNVDVSVVSRNVRDLEVSTGFLIFERVSRGVRATTTGQVYIASARDILERVDRAGQAAFLAAGGAVGRISVGFVWSFSSGPIVELLRSFHVAHPGVSVRTVEDGNEQLVTRLEAKDLDVILVATDPPPYCRLKSVGMFATLPLWIEPLCVAVPDACKQQAVTWFELAERPLLCQPKDDWRRFVAHVERLGGPTLQFAVQDVSREGLLGLVAAGLGWLIVPASVAHPNLPGLHIIPIISQGAMLLIEAIWNPEVGNAAINRFLAVARTTCSYGRADSCGEPR